MYPRPLLRLAAALLALTALPASAAPAPGEEPFTRTPMVLRYADPATPPEAGFEAFLADLPRVLAEPNERRRREAFAPRIDVWARGADMFGSLQPQPATRNWGDVEWLRSLLAADAPVGPLPDLPGSLCKPAGFALERGRAARIALLTNANGLFWSDVETTLEVASPSGRETMIAPAGTLLWTRAFPRAEGAELRPSIKHTSDGREVFVTARGPGALRLHDLRSSHVCFGRVGEQWKIVAVVTAKMKPK